jgi:hypothetical protein
VTKTDLLELLKKEQYKKSKSGENDSGFVTAVLLVCAGESGTVDLRNQVRKSFTSLII